MDKFYSKPIDIRSFKPKWLAAENLKRMAARNQELANALLHSSKRVEVKSCYVCGKAEREKFGSVYGIDYWKCLECGHIYAGFRLSQEDLQAYYASDSQYAKLTYADPETYQYRAREVAAPKVEFVQKYVTAKRRSWLDVGSGNGDVVYAASNAGFQATGLELSKESIAFGERVFGAKLLPYSVDQMLEQKGPGSFDVISYFNMLEHIPNPKAQVETSWKLLAPGGVLVAEVPNAQSLSGFSDLVFGEQVVRQLFPPHHIMVFSPQSLEYLVRVCGFQPEAEWFFGLDVYNLVLHLALANPTFLQSKFAELLLDLNNELQAVVDKHEASDQVMLLARKGK